MEIKNDTQFRLDYTKLATIYTNRWIFVFSVNANAIKSVFSSNSIEHCFPLQNGDINTEKRETATP